MAGSTLKIRVTGEVPNFFGSLAALFPGIYYSWAQSYANMNNDYLGGLGIHPRVTGIRINDARDTVYVAVSADISALFPSIAPKVRRCWWRKPGRRRCGRLEGDSAQYSGGNPITNPGPTSPNPPPDRPAFSSPLSLLGVMPLNVLHFGNSCGCEAVARKKRIVMNLPS